MKPAAIFHPTLSSSVMHVKMFQMNHHHFSVLQVKNLAAVCLPTSYPVFFSFFSGPIRKSKNRSSQSVCSPVHQSAIQPTNQSINRSINQSIKQSLNNSINQSIHQSINQAINQSIVQTHSINQRITQ